MSTTSFSLAHIAALQRTELDGLGNITSASLVARLVRPSSVVRIESLPRQEAFASHAARQRMMGDTLAGLGTGQHADHLIFIVTGSGGDCRVAFAVADGNGKAAPAGSLQAVLSANFPGISYIDDDMDSLLRGDFVAAAAVIGSPSPSWPEAPDDPGPLDRLIAGMRDTETGGSWAWCVVAQRLPWAACSERLSSVLAELRAVADQDRGAQPVAAYYRTLLQSVVDKLGLARSIGLWSVSAALAANSDIFLARARALAQSVFSGEESKPDPIRTVALTGVPLLPARFDAKAPQSPGPTFWTGAYTSLLHSNELEALIGVPRLERPGFEVRRAQRFRQAMKPGGADALSLGAILERGVPSGPTYTVDPSRLTSHALVAGGSGSGKTNTVFHLLRELWHRGTPFLVIEPTKTEYRALLRDPEIGPRLAVYTLGQEMVSPFRLNPFEAPKGVLIQTHLDRLKALFNASFTMYAPMPQVLERCLTDIYEDRGWNLATNENSRGEGTQAFPTLGDLLLKIDEVVPRLGYEARITADVSAALRTRIDSLRIGAKGLMLDTTEPADLRMLLDRPTVLEVDAIGDDDEKAFMVGLFFMRLAEEAMLAGPSDGRLRHLTVIEEAHRLFTDVPMVAGSEVGNPKGKAVETFCNMLSEIRVYGEGIVVVDQIPTRLAADTIKNTNLKVMHRLPASDDREVLGRTMAQRGDEIEAGGTLPVGVALAYTGGQSGSFEVAVPRAPSLGAAIAKDVSDLGVKTEMAARHPRQALAVDRPAVSLRQVQALLREDDLQEQAFRWIQSVAVSEGPALDVLLPLLQTVARHSSTRDGPIADILGEMLRATLRSCAHAAGWQFERLAVSETALLSGYGDVIEKLSGRLTPADAFAAFRQAWLLDGSVTMYPFPHCKAICPNFSCRYRHTAKRIAERDPLRTAWVKQLRSAEGSNLWSALVDVAERAVERGLSGTVEPEHRRRFAGCFALHSLDQDKELEQALRAKAIRNVIGEVDERLAAVDRVGTAFTADASTSPR